MQSADAVAAVVASSQITNTDAMTRSMCAFPMASASRTSAQLSRLVELLANNGVEPSPCIEAGTAMGVQIAVFVVVLVSIVVLLLQRMCNTCGDLKYDPNVEDPLMVLAVLGRVIQDDDGSSPTTTNTPTSSATNLDSQEDGKDSDKEARVHALLSACERSLMALVCICRQSRAATALQEQLRVVSSVIRSMAAAAHDVYAFFGMSFSGISRCRSHHPQSRHSKLSPIATSVLQLRIEALVHARSAHHLSQEQEEEPYPDAIAGGVPLAFTVSTANGALRRPRLYTASGAWIPVVLQPFAAMQRSLVGLEDKLEYDYNRDELLPR